MNRIASSTHNVASPFHPGHYHPTTGARGGAGAEATSAGAGAARGQGLRVDPAQLGGDPTGVKDSTFALKAAIAVCLNQSARSPK